MAGVRWIATFAAAGACGTAAGQPSDTSPRLAQPPVRINTEPTTPQRVEQMVGDVGPLGTSLRELSTDLRVPTSFDAVYRLPRGVAGIGGIGGQPQLARVNGAVIAVFPRSVYDWTDNGPRADVPPGTVYYIGSMPRAIAAIHAPGPTHVSLAADMSADRVAATGVSTTAEQGRTQTPSAAPTLLAAADRSRVLCVFTDEEFCAARVKQILEKAATAREKR